jgi:hypothetical protein
MRTQESSTEERIHQFLQRKTRQYPEIGDKKPRKISVYKRGQFLDEVNLFFNQRKLYHGE